MDLIVQQKFAPMDLEDETEFFGFVPARFMTELQEEIEEILVGEIGRLSGIDGRKAAGIGQQVVETFRKNYFMFSNFVLRNILKFPVSFQLERRARDVEPGVDVQGATDSLAECLSQERRYRSEVRVCRMELEVERYRRESYLSLLGCSDEVYELISRMKEVGREYAEVYEGYRKLALVSGGGDTELNGLLEHREIKSRMGSKEREELWRIGDVCVFSMLNGIEK